MDAVFPTWMSACVLITDLLLSFVTEWKLLLLGLDNTTENYMHEKQLEDTDTHAHPL